MGILLPAVAINNVQFISETGGDPTTTPLFIGNGLFPSAHTGDLINLSSASQIAQYAGASGTLALSLRHFFENGGESCYLLSVNVSAGPLPTQQQRLVALFKALKTLELKERVAAADNIGLLLAPELNELNDLDDTALNSLAGGITLAPRPADAPEQSIALWYHAWQAILALCPPGAGKFALLDVPDLPSRVQALLQQHFDPVQLSQGAAWWPRIQTTYHDESSSKNHYKVLSPLPAIAAVIQSSARQYGVWHPPANNVLAKTVRPVNSPVNASLLLNESGSCCNLIRSFVNKGVRIWGCRTLLNDPDSPWRYVQTRLLMNSIHRQLTALMRAYLFEPDHVLTWVKLKGQAWNWLRQLWLEGALYGTVEEEAFQLAIGLGETMTAEDITSGRMIMQVRLALLAPAEFIDISMTLDSRTGTHYPHWGAGNDA